MEASEKATTHGEGFVQARLILQAQICGFQGQLSTTFIIFATFQIQAYKG